MLDTFVRRLLAVLALAPVLALPVPAAAQGAEPIRIGILTVPTMVLIDKQGKVVSRNISIADLDDELKKLLGPAAARKTNGARLMR
jgi:hypothetical protein